MNYNNNNFLSTGFHWFIGVVEDIYDPYEQGRVRVRCFGYHTASKDKEDGIRTVDLPWANVMTPVSSASCSGVGESATGIVQGSWVVGFFRDGDACQDPLVLGTLPSRTGSSSAYETGFSDPFGEHPREHQANDQPKGATSEYRESKSYNSKSDLRVATKFVSTDKDTKEEIITDVPTAVPPDTHTLKNVLNKDEKFFERKTWLQHPQEDITNPTYPNCHTKEYNCGHTVEFDETPNNERILVQHAEGTYSEIDAEGNKTIVVNGDEYKVIIGGNNVAVKGHCNLTITGDARTLVKGDYYMEVEKDYHLLVRGNKHEKVVMSDFLEVNKNQMLNVTGNRITNIDAYEKRTISGVHGDDPVAYELECKKSGEINFGQNLQTIVMGNERRSTIGTLSQNTGARTDVIDTTYTIVATSTLDIDAAGKITVDTPDAMDLHAQGVTDIDGSRINLN